MVSCYHILYLRCSRILCDVVSPSLSCYKVVFIWLNPILLVLACFCFITMRHLLCYRTDSALKFGWFFLCYSASFIYIFLAVTINYVLILLSALFTYLFLIVSKQFHILFCVLAAVAPPIIFKGKSLTWVPFKYLTCTLSLSHCFSF